MYQPAGMQPDPQQEEVLDPIPSYLARLTQTPLLTADEERELSRQARNGCDSAKRRLVEANMRLVLNIAKHYRNRAIPFEDLVQEGAIGLMNAVERFDPNKGFRFSTYATHWIRQTIGRAVGTKAKPIRLPAHVMDQIRKAERTRVELIRMLGREPSVEEISERSGIAFERLITILQAGQDTVSLDLMVGEDESTDLMSLLPDKTQADPELATISKEAATRLQALLQELSERDRRVIRRRLGMDEEPPGVLQGIGNEEGLSRERIRQIEIQALKKLRQIAQRRKLREMFED